MRKTIVRRHLANTDPQSVWKELSEHVRTSSKGASEKRRLTQYVTNTVLDDNYKRTTVTEIRHMAHFWVSDGRCTLPGSRMGRSEGLSRRWTGKVLP